MRGALALGVLAAGLSLLVGCLPAELGGMPPSFGAFLRRNGMEFTRRTAPPAADPAAIAEIARSEGPNPQAAVNPPVYGVLTCPFACSGAVLSRPGERIEAWFVSFTGTEYGAGDIAWVIVDPAMGVRVVSTRDSP